MVQDLGLAKAQIAEILTAVPGQPQALFLLGAAHRLTGDPLSARAVLEPLVKAHPGWPEARYELGLTLGRLGDGPGAVSALRRALAAKPAYSQAWRALGDQLTLAGDLKGADEAYNRQIETSVQDPALIKAASAMIDGDLPVAERLLRAHLHQSPTDVAAIRMLAELGARLGRYEEAQGLLERCLELAPSFDAARHHLSVILYRRNLVPQALEQLEVLARRDPENPSHRNLKAAALAQIGDYAQAAALYAQVLKAYPNQPKAWMSYGHALKTLGRQDEAVAAYRAAIAVQPQLGEAWWSMANLKTFRFSAADEGAMGAALNQPGLSGDDRLHLEFSLGKAAEDRADYAVSFAHYQTGNSLRRAAIGYDPQITTDHLVRSRAVLTSDLFRSRAGQGCQRPDPLFILGLPRSGSTLIEQILSSHSQVEGTMELPDIGALAKRLGGGLKGRESAHYPEALADLSPAELLALGEEYLERTQVQRKSGRPLFIDKMPNNFAHIGLIHLILPNARIIDARRHPMGCCFSGFKQHFARGQSFSYGLEDIGRYYRDYVALMAHVDAVLPGRVHRVIYERLVADMETEVRALLDHCGLPFEEACLRFHENDRAVRTASSEQVRQPIFTDGVDHWRHFEPWLGPLKAALGPVLEAYPAAPAGL